MTKFIPLSDRIVVVRDQEKGVSSGGIIIPESAQERPCKGTVIAVGKGRTMPDGYIIKMTLQAGDTVMFPSVCGAEIKIDGKECRIMREDDILGILS